MNKDCAKSTQPQDLMFSKEETKKLYKLLSCCFVVQRTYGKQAFDLVKTTEIFASLLKGYDFNLIISSFENWLKESQDFPTPSDIIKMVKEKKANLRKLEIKNKEKRNIKIFLEKNKNLSDTEIKNLNFKLKMPDFRKSIGLEPFGDRYKSFIEMKEAINDV